MYLLVDLNNSSQPIQTSPTPAEHFLSEKSCIRNLTVGSFFCWKKKKGCTEVEAGAAVCVHPHNTHCTSHAEGNEYLLY